MNAPAQFDLRLLSLQMAIGLACAIGWPARADTAPAAEASTEAPSQAQPADGKTAADDAPSPHDRGHRRNTGSPLDRRVALLAKELNLDASQRVRVKQVLEAQRAQVDKVWNDTSLPAAVRVSTTQSIGDRTADQIRALLNEEQRKKYIQPRQRDAAVGTAGSDVEAWMNTSKRKQPAKGI